MKNIFKAKKQSVVKYIKSQRWFCGVRDDQLLLLYSSKRNSYNNYFKKEYGINFAETLLVPLKRNYPVRVFNLSQVKKFHLVSSKKIKKNPQILSFYVRENENLYKNINRYGKKMLFFMEKSDIAKSSSFFKKILDLYEVASAQFFIIFSLGLMLDKNKNNLKDVENIIKEHNEWRNNVAFKEESLVKKLSLFFKFLLGKKELKLNPTSLINFLTLNEIQLWLNGELNDIEVKNLIKLRKTYGFVYLNLKDEKQEIIDDPLELKKIQRYFLELDKSYRNLKNINKIKGQAVYISDQIVKGQVIVLKNKSDLKYKHGFIKGKILVAMQTTPHFIPYIKNVKAIITDEGGLTCHAAILAREFKKPCIVGTKIATQFLKNNDFVEIDTNKGIIKIKNNLKKLPIQIEKALAQ